MTNIKKIIFDHIAREKLLSGIDQAIHTLCDACKEQTELPDPFENIGAFFTKELAQKLLKECKTHLSTGLTLFRAFVEEGIKQIDLGVHPVDLKIGMEKGLEALVHQVDKQARPVSEMDQLFKILGLSQTPDVENLIREIEKKEALFSEIVFEKTPSDSHVQVVNGLKIAHDHTTSCLRSQPENITKIDPSILIIDKHIFSIYELLPILQLIPSNNLLIIARDIEKDVLSTLIVNNLYQHLSTNLVKTSYDLEKVISFTNASSIKKGYFLGNAQASRMQENKTILFKDSSEGEPVLLVPIKTAAQEDFTHKKILLEDSLFFIKAALGSNLVPGVGNWFTFASPALDTLHLDEKEKAGLTVLKRGCTALLQKTTSNETENPEPALFVKKSLVFASQKAATILSSQALIADEY